MATILERIRKVTVDQLGVDEKEVIPTASFADDLGADSLDLVELMMSLEEAFNGVTKSFVLDGRKIEVKIPKGVKQGSRIKLAGQGQPGPSGQRGDLYLVVRERPHQRYERKGPDMVHNTEVTVPYYVAALGGETSVQTLTGRVSMKIPPGTQSGQMFRLPGQGMPHLNRDERGDLYVKVRVSVPKTLSAREKELLNELADLHKRGSKSSG